MSIRFDEFNLDDEILNLEEGLDETDLVYIKSGGWLDGATTLEDAAQMARDLADYLEHLVELGYELIDTIEDDRGLAHRVEN